MKARHFLVLIHHRGLPWAVAACVATLMAVSMLKQWHAWSALTAERPLQDSEALVRNPINIDRLSTLFGSPAAVINEPQKVVSVPIILLGSFVHPIADRSSAILRISGEAPVTVRVGQQIIPGVHLETIRADHVEVSRNGTGEKLFFPNLPGRPTNMATGIINARPPLTAALLENLRTSAADQTSRRAIETLHSQVRRLATSPAAGQND